MSRLERRAMALLMFFMVLISGVFIYASVYASVSGTQSLLGGSGFDAPTGIRYNPTTKDFDIFSAAGVSWINSGRWISVDGAVTTSSTNPASNNAQATGAVRYNIMCDIAYPTSTELTALGANFNATFKTTKLTIPAGATLNGRGFYLKGFPVLGSTLATALVATNNGTIRNLIMTNVNITGSANAVGMICATNAGTIDNCVVYGEGANNKYESSSYSAMYAIAAENKGTISNCVNNANLNNTATNSFVAGIAGADVSSAFINNMNNGTISAVNGTTNVAGIAIISGNGNFEVTVRGNTNNNTISGNTIACGIVGSTNVLKALVEAGNFNNGDLSADNTYEIFRTE